jgi:nucleotide-binding universal stress UspA family protein
MFRVILAAVDASPLADAVIQMAIELADRFDAQIHLFRVVHRSSEFPPSAATHEDSFNRDLAADARAQLAILAGGRERITVEPPVLSPQEPWHAITEAARRMNADLIVIGSHAYGGWDRVLGTTSGKIVDRTDRHVFVVHERLP